MGRPSKAALRAPPGLPISTFVLDNGGYTVKAGYVPDQPQPDEETLSRCHVIPNAIVRTRDRKTYIGAQVNTDITQWNEAIFRRPVEHGQIVGWEAQKEIWDQSIFDERTAHSDLLIKEPEATTLILSEAPNALPALQKNADEIIMEEWGFGGYMKAMAPSLNAYNNLHPLFEGKTNPNEDVSAADLPMECLLVIDSGYSNTTITPLFNGRPLHRAIRRIDFGGKHFTNLLKEVISVRYFDLHQDTKIVNDVKEDVCFVSTDFKADLEKTWKGNKGRQKVVNGTTNDSMDVDSHPSTNNEIRVEYILPDGIHLQRGFSRPYDPSTAAAKKRKLNASMPADTEISMTLGNERFTVPEIIFSPSDIGSKQPGLADCVMQSLATLPHLVQATMLSNVLVVGGNAKIPGFVDRIQAELRTRTRTEWQVRVRKMNDPITSTWLGGARLAAGHRDVVREYGVTKDEYFEHGSAWVARKFLTGIK